MGDSAVKDLVYDALTLLDPSISAIREYDEEDFNDPRISIGKVVYGLVLTNELSNANYGFATREFPLENEIEGFEHDKFKRYEIPKNIAIPIGVYKKYQIPTVQSILSHQIAESEDFARVGSNIIQIPKELEEVSFLYVTSRPDIKDMSEHFKNILIYSIAVNVGLQTASRNAISYYNGQIQIARYKARKAELRFAKTTTIIKASLQQVLRNGRPDGENYATGRS